MKIEVTKEEVVNVLEDCLKNLNNCTLTCITTIMWMFDKYDLKKFDVEYATTTDARYFVSGIVKQYKKFLGIPYKKIKTVATVKVDIETFLLFKINDFIIELKEGF